MRGFSRFESARNRAPLDINRAQVVIDRRSGMSLTEVAKKYRISRATVCRLVNECGGLKKSCVLHPGNQEAEVPVTEASNLLAAA